MMVKQDAAWGSGLKWVVGAWAIATVVAGLWLWLDHGVPSWDPAEHLNNALSYWWTLTHGDWQSALGRDRLWILSPKYPPFLYLTTALLHAVFGPSSDLATLINSLFALVLMISVYGLGRHLFHTRVGVIAALISLLFPRLFQLGLDYQLDYAVTAMVILSLWCLTVWRDALSSWRQGLWMLGFSLSLGLAILTKQSALLFFLVPLLWLFLGNLLGRRWGQLLQLVLGAAITGLVLWPWLHTNWVFQLSVFENTNVQSAAKEGDPALDTLAAWTYYWSDLPRALSWPLLLVPLVGLVFWGAGVLPGRRSPSGQDGSVAGVRWLAVYLVGAYLLWSAIANKDPRYIAPYLPVLGILLAWGLDCWWRRWPWVAWGTLALSGGVALLSLLPPPLPAVTQATALLAPRGQWPPYRGDRWPHAAIIDHTIASTPHQIVNLGALRSSPQINQHNLSYYGKLRNFQVFARQMGNRESQIDRDLQAMNWFYAQFGPGDPWPETGTMPEATLVRRLRGSETFVRDRQWNLPDGSQLVLYRRRQMPITVEPLEANACPTDAPVRLSQVTVPATSPPGLPLPVTYTWEGTWAALQSGLVLLTWQPAAGNAPTWIHDHGIGLGSLHPAPIQANQLTQAAPETDPDACFRVVERTATLPPEALRGAYTLTARYQHQQAADPVSLNAPAVSVTLDPAAAPNPSAHLDWVTQLRQLATRLPQGPDALGTVFDSLGRINLYDPIQNYTVQAEESLERRWQENPEALDYGYGLVLARILQRKVDPAVAALTQLADADPENPYVYAYLGLVNLYALRPWAAQAALQPALELAPDSPEIQGLSALAALFQGNLWGAWQRGSRALELANDP